MPDRIIRDELLESDRWLDLPTDSHRLIYIALLMRADDYGNIEGGPRRLFRWMHGFTQIKAEADSIKVMSDLQDSDLVRRYEVEGKEYWHLPRFRNSRWYWVRKCPKSPFQEEEIPENQKDRKKTRQIQSNTRRGVGVGVGENPVQHAAADAGLELRRRVWNAYSNAYQDRYGVPPTRNAESNSAIKRFCSQIPAEECEAVAAFYLTHNHSFYVTKAHNPKHLASDAAKLRTEWATGKQITQTEAMQKDKTAARHNVYKRLIDNENF